ncbi:MAG TPA: hypothetical protein VG755_33185 [Nannocystaceae bacterium]|nr:hypothetical protein [Nannocystaceae bacterium]
MPARVVAAFALASACARTPADDLELGSDAGDAATVSTTSTSSSTSSTSSESSSSEDDGTVVLDVASHSDLGGAPLACRAIDFLFVVDDSGSMDPYQQALVASFPGFIAGIEDALATVDGVHVAVTTSDSYVYNTPECTWIGSSIVRTGGEASSNATCGPYAEGHNYMTEADDLGERFACAARVGTGGDPIERPMNAVVDAMRDATPGTHPCNAGFIRDDARLVVLVITDEYDGPDDPEGDGSLGTPQSWYDAVVAAKGGLASNVAVVVLTHFADGPCPPADVGHDGVHLVDFAQRFGDHGFVGGICEPDYAVPFAEAIDVVVQACSDFVPPG